MKEEPLDFLGIPHVPWREDVNEAEIKAHQHHRHRQVLKSSIEEFQVKYITAVELACQMDTSSRKVVSRLRAQNVLPISGKLVDCGRQYLFLRKEASIFFYIDEWL